MLAAAALAFAVAAEDPLLADIRSKLADPGKPFVLHVTFKLNPGADAEFAAAAKPAVAATRKEKGCLAYEFSTAHDDPAAVLLYERWATLDDLAAHLKADHTKSLLGKLAELTTDLKLAVRRPVGD